MDIERIHKALTGGETTRVEFKSCRDKVSNSVYDTVCSFSNHSGGLIILGFDDDMNLIGVNKNASVNLKKNIINTLGNKEVFFPKLTIEPEIEEYDGKTIIVIDVPVSQYPVRYKNKYFDRVGDADMDITDNMELVLGLFERKNPHLFEDRLVPGLKMKDLDSATFKFCRNAATTLNPLHAWQDMTDMEILESCRLLKKNEAGEIEGFKYAALLLFGSDDAIAEHLPRYKFELLYHKMTYERFNMNLPEDSARYDDRKTVRSNIIQAYRQMLDFVVKYLPDKFYLPDNGSTARLDLRVQIFREIIGNICAHSDYQPGFGGYVEVFYDRVITKNATRLIPTMKEGSLTLDELGPYTKNPLIVKVLNELHFVEDLGSGRRNLKRYAPLYYPDYKIEISNGNQFEFSITYDDLSRGKANETANNTENQHNKEMQSQNETPNEIAVDTARASSKANINAVYNAIKANTDISVDDICRICKISRATAARAIAWLKENKYIDRTTANQYGSWIILK